MKIVITGAGGQLGRALQNVLAPHDIVALEHIALDITDREAVRAAIFVGSPDLVIHPAAWTDTAGCEGEPERATRVNGEGARNVAEAAREANAAMLHISTNEVFDGEKGAAYDEDDTTNAINAYGRSKLAGEQAVRESLPEHYIVRSSWLYGAGRESFPEKILRAARDRKKLRVVSDEVASPTLTVDLAHAVGKLIETKSFGTYHLANGGECSRKEWAEEVLRLTGIDVPVEATTQADYGSVVRKPVYSVLTNNRAAKLGITLRPWREALSEYVGTGIASQSRARA